MAPVLLHEQDRRYAQQAFAAVAYADLTTNALGDLASNPARAAGTEREGPRSSARDLEQCSRPVDRTREGCLVVLNALHGEQQRPDEQLPGMWERALRCHPLHPAALLKDLLAPGAAAISNVGNRPC
ncbi:hypothetical protein ACGFX8_34970 [Streptomyces sp. NPDC048362]|uniref:hypothetical protein n=1 Tax=Streptomyces sp. NPDC048362 TaxID=3365539 RepID=UPI00371A5CA3